MRCQTGDVFENRRDVGEGGKEARRRQHADAKHHDDLRVFQHAELAQETGLLHLDLCGQAYGQRRGGQHADDGHGPERGPPADGLTERGAKRHAEHVSERKTREHQGDGLGTPVRRHQTGCNHRSDPEERAVAKRGHDARDHQDTVVGRHGTQQVADNEHADQTHQGFLARHIGDRDGDDRGTDRHAERIGRHQHAGRRDRDGEVARHVGQQAHDDEFRGTDSKRGNSKGKQRQRHDGIVRRLRISRMAGARFRSESAGADRANK